MLTQGQSRNARPSLLTRKCDHQQGATSVPNPSTFAMIRDHAGRAVLHAANRLRLTDRVREDDTDPCSVDAHSQQALWLRELYTGMVGFIGGGGAGLFYVFRTWDSGSNRVSLALLGFFSIVQALVVWFGRGHFVTPTQRRRFSIVWNVSTYALIATASALDGGIGSPLALIWVLPTLYLLMGFSRAAVLFCGSFAIALYLVVAWLTPGGLHSAAFAMQVVVLVVAVFMVFLGAVAREERQEVLEAVQRQLSVLATTDGLTGCLNQQAFTHLTATEVTRAVRYQHDISMLALDVDHFKSINDEHGHLIGDEVLRQLGAALRANVRGTDIVARVGGDELLVLCPETGLNAATEMAERLRSSARQLQVPARVTLSVGICTLRPNTPDPQPLREYADRALYEAKQQGRDRYVVFTPPDPLAVA
ncbi:MAG: GGDEF domain-containing protein [Rhodanobacter sp.]